MGDIFYTTQRTQNVVLAKFLFNLKSKIDSNHLILKSATLVWTNKHETPKQAQCTWTYLYYVMDTHTHIQTCMEIISAISFRKCTAFEHHHQCLSTLKEAISVSNIHHVQQSDSYLSQKRFTNRTYVIGKMCMSSPWFNTCRSEFNEDNNLFESITNTMSVGVLMTHEIHESQRFLIPHVPYIYIFDH